MQYVSPRTFAVRSQPDTDKLAFLLLDGFTHLAFACAVEPLRLANLAAGRGLYGWRAISVSGKSVRSSSDIGTTVDGSILGLMRDEVLVLVGGLPARPEDIERVIPFLRREHAHGRKIMALCGGVTVLAEAGLLDGMDCAVHWQVAHGFSERFPKARACLAAFVKGRMPTASGGTAAADLMLAVIREEHGDDLALKVADLMVHRSVRDAHSPQTSSLMFHIPGRNPKLAKIVQAMEANIDAPLCAEALADKAGVSIRQMERLFNRYMGTSPKKHYQQLRLSRARDLLVQTDLSVTEISIATGFASPSHFSKRFKAQFGISAHTRREAPLLLSDLRSSRAAPSCSGDLAHHGAAMG